MGSPIHLFSESDGICPSNLTRERKWLEYLADHYDYLEVDYSLAINYGYGQFGSSLDFGTYVGWHQLRQNPNLGDGEGIEAEKGFVLLKQTAEAGFPMAAMHLAIAYQDGYFGYQRAYQFKADPKLSLFWLKQAIASEAALKKWEYYSSGQDIVKFAIAYRYRYGEEFGIEEDRNEAFERFAALAVDNMYSLPDAMVELALLCAEMTIRPAVCAEASNAHIATKINAFRHAEYKAGFLAAYHKKLQLLNYFKEE